MVQKIRVLIVEDSEDDTLLLLRELRRGGYAPEHRRVETAGAMEAALEEREWDIVIADHSMPAFSAPEALRILKRRGLDLPFIILSGCIGEDVAVEAMKAGAHDYIVKGDLARLNPAIQRELREAAMRRERRRADEELKESEERYRTVVEQTTESIFLAHPQTRLILESNPAFQRLLGYTAEELRSMTLDDIIDHSPESIRQNIRRILKHRRYKVGERRYRCKDGSPVDVEVSVSAISYRGEELLCIVAHDITERKRAEARLRRSLNVLLALYEAGHVLSSSLDRQEIGAELLGIMQRVSSLAAAALRLREGSSGEFRLWESVGPEEVLVAASRTPTGSEARRAALASGRTQTFRLPEAGTPPAGLCLPLRVRDRVIGLLEAYGPESLLERETVELLSSLTSQAGSALENARLYGELAEHEQQLKELVGKLLVAQEEERHRVAYDVHDGLAQMLAASYQNLQAFAISHAPGTPEARRELESILNLLRSTVREARRIIADLRPTMLDDFGLGASVRQQVEALRAEGWEVSYDENLGDLRLPVGVETALFRIVQEALTNVRKHAGTDRVDILLRREGGEIRLEVRDGGSGFPPEKLLPEAPGERIGLSGMRERASLMGGRFEVRSKPGSGTAILVTIPESRVLEGGRD
ncbi:PAS domain S-box protein [Rubrobacter taiwanensis]|uniref:Oxygen sensor histidine kinase NreB n=1 Tax=Rubrobacter taiwanensis TaxID=185139 RepID=A0A4R1BM18_9ACTN|nr:PAS domain S-box protein [Rubrobacter taiwanensis]TCJ18473.1 PAS domain S-box protein [Rubrobacter taiwanensis]